MARRKSVLSEAEMGCLREMLHLGMALYGVTSQQLKSHSHTVPGHLVCVNEEDRAIPCPCTGQTARQVTRMIEKINARAVTPEYGYTVLCMLSATKKAAAWRERHDPGEDEWRWRMYRAYLDLAPFAGPVPRELEQLEAPIGIPTGAERRLARDIARTLCEDHSLLPKRSVSEVQNVVTSMLTRKRQQYNYAFATWLLNTSSMYTVVVDEADVEIRNIIVRTGPASSEVHEVKRPRTKYEVHHRHAVSNGTRAPEPWEVAWILSDRDPITEANERIAALRSPRGHKRK